jgi:hypothetical protein
MMTTRAARTIKNLTIYYKHEGGGLSTRPRVDEAFRKTCEGVARMPKGSGGFTGDKASVDALENLDHLMAPLRMRRPGRAPHLPRSLPAQLRGY